MGPRAFQAVDPRHSGLACLVPLSRLPVLAWLRRLTPLAAPPPGHKVHGHAKKLGRERPIEATRNVVRTSSQTRDIERDRVARHLPVSDFSPSFPGRTYAGHCSEYVLPALPAAPPFPKAPAAPPAAESVPRPLPLVTL